MKFLKRLISTILLIIAVVLITYFTLGIGLPILGTTITGTALLALAAVAIVLAFLVSPDWLSARFGRITKGIGTALGKGIRGVADGLGLTSAFSGIGNLMLLGFFGYLAFRVLDNNEQDAKASPTGKNQLTVDTSTFNYEYLGSEKYVNQDI